MEIIMVDIENSLNTFIEQFMNRIEDHTVLIFTSEEKIIIQNFIAHKAGLTASDLQKGKQSQYEFEKFFRASTWVKEQKIFFSNFDSTDIELKKEEIDRSIEETTPDVVFIDKKGLDDAIKDYIENYLAQ